MPAASGDDEEIATTISVVPRWRIYRETGLADHEVDDSVLTDAPATAGGVCIP